MRSIYPQNVFISWVVLPFGKFVFLTDLRPPINRSAKGPDPVGPWRGKSIERVTSIEKWAKKLMTNGHFVASTGLQIPIGSSSKDMSTFHQRPRLTPFLMVAVYTFWSFLPQFSSFSHSHAGAGEPHTHGLFPFGHIDRDPASDADGDVSRPSAYFRSAEQDFYSETSADHSAILGFLNSPRVHSVTSSRPTSGCQSGTLLVAGSNRHVHDVVQNNVPALRTLSTTIISKTFASNGWFESHVYLHRPVLSRAVRGPPSLLA